MTAKAEGGGPASVTKVGGGLKKRWAVWCAVAYAVLAAGYWLGYASDRYISEAHVIIQSTQGASGQSFDLGSLLGNATGGAQTEQLLLRDYLLSVDMLKKLDARLHLKEHYGDPRRDLLSRLGGGADGQVELEEFHDHYLERVSVEYDDYAGVLAIKAQAYDPETARAIAAALVEDGERFMDSLARGLAQAQVDFLEKEITDLGEGSLKARRAVLDYQDRHGLVSPQGTTENLAAIVNNMESQLSGLKANRAALLGYLMPTSASVAELDLQIRALEQQIASEKAKLAAPQGKTLNRTVEEYQRLEMAAGFAQDLYKTALTALEQGRFEAARTLKKMSVLQAPTLPEYPLEPRRLHNSLLHGLIALIGAGLLQLVGAIIRDHQD